MSPQHARDAHFLWCRQNGIDVWNTRLGRSEITPHNPGVTAKYEKGARFNEMFNRHWKGYLEKELQKADGIPCSNMREFDAL